MVPPFNAGGTCMLSDAVQLINAIHLDWNQQDVCMWCVYVLYMLRFFTHGLSLFLQKHPHICEQYNNTYIIYLCSFSAISKVEKYGNLGRVPELNSKQCFKKRQLWVVWPIWKFKVIFVGVFFPSQTTNSNPVQFLVWYVYFSLGMETYHHQRSPLWLQILFSLSHTIQGYGILTVPTCTTKINQMKVNIPYMDPMGLIY